ncbi:MAG: hypothetical protein ACKOX7_00950, partial [Bacteroidota bacterium]
MKKLLLFQSLLTFALAAFLTGCGGSGSDKAELELNYQKHAKATAVSEVESILRGDTVSVDPSYDLYFDFSSTMKRAVTDKVYSGLITAAIFESDNNTNCYIIGANPDLKPVTGDNTARKNTFLDVKNYSEMNTYMTANINNIVANAARPSIVFTDFSIDENKPTIDMNGVKSSFIRGPEFKTQFAKWFKSGGSVRVYGKRSSVEGLNMPIYVIAFIPRGMDNKHKSNNLLSQLDAQLKDIYFNLHPDFVKVEAVPNDKKMSDYLGLSQSKGGEALPNGMGEVLIYDGGALLSKLKKDAKAAATTFFDGISYSVDSSSFLGSPEFSIQVDEFKPKTKDKLDTELGKAPTFFGNITVGSENKFLIPLTTATAKLDKYYQDPRFFRIAIKAKGGSLNFDSQAAEKDLAYDLKSGGKKLLNKCLVESIAKGLDEAKRDNQPRTLYIICA